MTDDVSGQPVPGLEAFAGLVNVAEPYPLTFLEQYALTESTAELTTSCYAGMLMLQSMGSAAGCSTGSTATRCLGRAEIRRCRGSASVTTRTGVGPCRIPRDATACSSPSVLRIFRTCEPPSMPSPSESSTPAARSIRIRPAPGGRADGSERRRGSTPRRSRHAWRCRRSTSSTDSEGSPDGPEPFCLTYLQAHHLDLEFYDRHFDSGAYLPTHAEHMDAWHSP